MERFLKNPETPWSCRLWTVSGNFTGYRVERFVNNELQVAYGKAAENGDYATATERRETYVAAQAVAEFLNAGLGRS